MVTLICVIRALDKFLQNISDEYSTQLHLFCVEQQKSTKQSIQGYNSGILCLFNYFSLYLTHYTSALQYLN